MDRGRVRCRHNGRIIKARHAEEKGEGWGGRGKQINVGWERPTFKSLRSRRSIFGARVYACLIGRNRGRELESSPSGTCDKY